MRRDNDNVLDIRIPSIRRNEMIEVMWTAIGISTVFAFTLLMLEIIEELHR